MNSKYKYYRFILIISSFAILGCSTQNKYKVLTFLFDGVPDTTKTISSMNKDLLNKQDTSGVVASNINEIYTHPPYQENECEICHDKNSRGNTVLKQPELCSQCHEDFKSKFKYVHGPVEGGFCTSCHNPHMSKSKHLLLRDGQNLCTFCHEINQVKKNEMHGDIGDASCLECHHPHGGEDNFILR